MPLTMVIQLLGWRAATSVDVGSDRRRRDRAMAAAHLAVSACNDSAAKPRFAADALIIGYPHTASIGPDDQRRGVPGAAGPLPAHGRHVDPDMAEHAELVCNLTRVQHRGDAATYSQRTRAVDGRSEHFGEIGRSSRWLAGVRSQFFPDGAIIPPRQQSRKSPARDSVDSRYPSALTMSSLASALNPR